YTTTGVFRRKSIIRVLSPAYPDRPLEERRSECYNLADSVARREKHGTSINRQPSSQRNRAYKQHSGLAPCAVEQSEPDFFAKARCFSAQRESPFRKPAL